MRVDDDEVVFRQVRLDMFPEDSGRPLPLAFRPSSADEQEGQQRGELVQLSVWDAHRTTPEQATSIRERERGGPVAPSKTVCLRVGRVRELSEPSVLGLDVVRAPLVLSVEGADGHCGITGLGKRDHPTSKRLRKRYMFELARSCQPGTSWRKP